MREIVERLFENRRNNVSDVPRLQRVETSKDTSLGTTTLYLFFSTQDTSRGVYDCILDDAYPNAPILKKQLLDVLNSLEGNHRKYPYVRAVINNVRDSNEGFIRPGKIPIK